jgi:hypothetical protein
MIAPVDDLNGWIHRLVLDAKITAVVHFITGILREKWL